MHLGVVLGHRAHNFPETLRQVSLIISACVRPGRSHEVAVTLRCKSALRVAISSRSLSLVAASIRQPFAARSAGERLCRAPPASWVVGVQHLRGLEQIIALRLVGNHVVGKGVFLVSVDRIYHDQQCNLLVEVGDLHGESSTNRGDPW
jgi:hypothetical protein